MTPTKAQHVKCVLKNNAVLEGIVEEWTASEVVLKSLDGKSIMIVHGGVSDIVFTKVILEEETCLTKAENISEVISEKVKELVEIPEEDADLKSKSVKELVSLRNEQERRIIQDKLKEHAPTGVRTVQYGTPRFLTKHQS
jgi:hypothetical protein